MTSRSAARSRPLGIAPPRIATGVGDLDWSEVKPLVQSHLGGLKIPLFVSTEYHKGVAAKEPGL